MKKLLLILLFLPLCVSGQNVRAFWLNGDCTDRIGIGDMTNKNITFVNGAYNQSGYFNGTTAYAVGNPDTNIKFTNRTFTVAAWIKTASANTQIIIAHGGKNTVLQNGWMLYIENNKLVALIRSGIARSSTLSINDDKWHYCVAIMSTRTAAPYGNIDLYVDGVLNQGTLTTTDYYTPSTDSLYIGRRTLLATTQLWFIGNIDEVMISTGAWTPAEIKQKYLYYKGFMQ